MGLPSALPASLPPCRGIASRTVPYFATGSARQGTAPRLAGVQRSLFYGFAAFVVSVALPGKFLFYISPFVLLAVSMSTVPLVSVPRLAILYGGLFGLSLVSVLIDKAGGAQVNFPGLLLATVTYASVLALMAPAILFRTEPALMLSVARLCTFFLLLQGMISVAQFVATGDGDYVSGSFGLFDFVSGNKTISQVNLTFALFCMIVFLLPYARTVPWATTAIVFGILACAIAQTGHQTIFFLLALPAAAIRGFRVRGIARALGILALTVILILAFYPGTSFLVQEWMRKVVFADDSLKRAVIETGFVRLADSWKNALFGLGLGQYTSRASLFAAGFQSSVPLPSMLTGASDYFTTDVLPLILRHEHIGEGSAIAKPYFSAISVIVEVGPLLTAAFIWRAVHEFRSLAPGGRRARLGAEDPALYCRFFILFLTLNCLVENYLELVQAIAIPSALYAIARGRQRMIVAQLGPQGGG